MKNKATEFRQQWSHKPTPIPQNATGLWYSEECVDQLMAEFAASAPVQPGPRPKCPKCHSSNIGVHWCLVTIQGERHSAARANCGECKFTADCHMLADFAQFFTSGEQKA